MALKLKGSTSGFVGLDAPAVSGNNTLILPENSGSAFQLFANDITAGVTTFTSVSVNRNGDLTVPGTISIGGTLTYEDVTSVDSVGVVTARGLSIFGNTTGLQVASGISTFQGISLSGNTTGLNVTGVGTFVNGSISLTSGGAERLNIASPSGGNLVIKNPSNAYVSFGTNDTERMRIDSSGDLLLGTTTSAGKLTVDSGTSNTCATFQSSDSGAGINVKDDSARSSIEQNGVSLKISSDTGAEHANSDIRLQVDGSTKMLIDSSGRVLIGTTVTTDAPANDAGDIIIGTTSDTQKGITIVGSTSGGINNIFFSDGAGYNNQGRIAYYHADDSMRFTTNVAERARITSTGNLLVNSTTSAGTDYKLESYSAGAYNIMAKSTNGNGGYHNFTGQASNGTITSYISHNGRGYFEDGVQFDSSGETLNSYEEGTFTPTQPAIGFNSASGTYTRIGRLVTAQIFCTLPTNSSGQYFVIDGLPFTAINPLSGSDVQGGYVIYSTYGAAVLVRVNCGGTRTVVNGIGGSNITLTTLDNVNFRLQVHYFTT